LIESDNAFWLVLYTKVEQFYKAKHLYIVMCMHLLCNFSYHNMPYA